MATDYTPSTAGLRVRYASFPNVDCGTFEERGVEFDRWLAAHDREIKATALEEFADFQERSTRKEAHVMDDTDWAELAMYTSALRAYANKVYREVAK